MWIHHNNCSASAQGSEALTLDSVKECASLAETFAQSAMWRGKHIPRRSWQRKWKTAPWTQRLSGWVISKSYPRESFPALTGSSVATHASPSATQESDWEKTTLAICGLTSSASSTLFDPEASSSKTSLDTSSGVCLASFKTWESVASAVRSDCLRRRKSAHPTSGKGSSSSVWPTTTVSDGFSSARHTTTTGVSHKGTTLTDAVRLWPTASARDWKDTYGMSVTPKGTRKKKRLDQLPRAVFQSDGQRDQGPRSSRGSRPVLCAEWVEALMGFPIGWSA